MSFGKSFAKKNDAEDRGREDHAAVEGGIKDHTVEKSRKGNVHAVIPAAENTAYRSDHKKCFGIARLLTLPFLREPSYGKLYAGEDEHGHGGNDHHVARALPSARFGKEFENDADACRKGEKEEAIDQPQLRGAFFFLRFFISTKKKCGEEQRNAHDLHHRDRFLPNDDANACGKDQGAVADERGNGNGAVFHCLRLEKHKKLLGDAVKDAPQNDLGTEPKRKPVQRKKDPDPKDGGYHIENKQIAPCGKLMKQDAIERGKQNGCEKQ